MSEPDVLLINESMGDVNTESIVLILRVSFSCAKTGANTNENSITE